MMIRFFGQPKFDCRTQKLIGYEFLLRETYKGCWRLPTQFQQFSANTLSQLLCQTIQTLPQDLVLISFNLNQAQFVEPAFQPLLAQVQAQTKIQLYVELTEQPTATPMAALIQAAADFQQAGLKVCLDDVGTGANQLALVAALAPYVVEYKFALQNFRPAMDLASLAPRLRFWRELARRQHKAFAVEGFESAADLAALNQYAPTILQGYYFGKPRLLALPDDPAA
ncbi:EAL domain-containing protein [Loigolactobacillus bifermentans]|uniref:C-di-GMP-specific phosphodiesterase n=1 Tax=Loigolactobacillus bifermentans DSM 20003 TaxID=1423726 RepID=A0A0R1GR95_9LACO|nr:EAL domain-containing protein [Loigolactobacillus bifermentans]KRK33415.1 C-di-GMP-specific phosphodiesterase [Loigolactobacillus bifermentans DSM 20003]QGG61407.1 EAL domain-containing protein [Loigolactobacillus bifermentans]